MGGILAGVMRSRCERLGNTSRDSSLAASGGGWESLVGPGGNRMGKDCGKRQTCGGPGGGVLDWWWSWEVEECYAGRAVGNDACCHLAGEAAVIPCMNA